MTKASDSKKAPRSAPRPKIKPSRSKTKPPRKPERPWAGEGDLFEEIADVVAEPERWLRAPNPLFGMSKPIELIGTKDEEKIRQWIGRVKHGFVT